MYVDLGQVAAMAMVLTCIKGVLSPMVEVFKTTPPTWSKLLLMLVLLDSVAICYLTIKSVEPLEQLVALATENQPTSWREWRRKKKWFYALPWNSSNYSSGYATLPCPSQCHKWHNSCSQCLSSRIQTFLLIVPALCKCGCYYHGLDSWVRTFYHIFLK